MQNNEEVKKCLIFKIEDLYERYRSSIEFMDGNLCNPSVESVDQDIWDRDYLEILTNVLKNDFDCDISQIEVNVNELDTQLMNNYRNNSCCIYFEKEFYPANFWWRHPSNISNK